VSSASRRSVTAGELFALVGQPKPEQKPQSMHAGRPRYGRDATAVGYANG
jgi:hypothetical protein